jgi:hypothetical protein
MSSRHGLRYLLDAAAETKIPVFLLDLLKPETLSALDYIDALSRIRDLINQGIIGAPEFSYLTAISPDAKQSAYEKYLYYMNQRDGCEIDGNVSLEKIYEISEFVFLKESLDMFNCNSIYNGGNDYAQLIEKVYNCPFTAFHNLDGRQISEMMMNCKELLLYSHSTTPTPLIFGGDFSDSVLGDPTISSPFFTYIQNHPWIQALSLEDIPEESSPQPNKSSSSIFSLPGDMSSNFNMPATHTQNDKTKYSSILDDLAHAPANRFTYLAWEVLLSFYNSSSPDIISLGNNYVGQIGYLIAASNWASQPTSRNSCTTDLDYDEEMECVLSNDNIYVIIDPEGGYIPFIFSKDDSGLHQIVGPTWEFILGVSDPTMRDLSLGVRSDPGQILGAFDWSDSSNNTYSTSHIGNRLVIDYGGNLPLRKTFTVSDNGIRIDINNSITTSEKILIPLVVDPWTRFTTGWEIAITL